MLTLDEQVSQIIPLAISSTRQQIQRGEIDDKTTFLPMSLNLLSTLHGQKKNIAHFDIIEQAQLDSVNTHQVFLKERLLSDPSLIKQFNVLLIADLDKTNTPYFEIKDFVGTHNRKIFQNFAYSELKNHKLIIPFEMFTILTGSLGGVDKDYAFSTNPTHECFKHFIRPAPVVGVAMGGDLEKLVGYVTNPKLLEIYLNLMDDDMRNTPKGDLEFDTQSALRLLKYRYDINVNQQTLDAITQYEQDLSKHQKGKVIIEIHNR